MTLKIAPSILSADFANLAAEIKRAEDGGADFIHVDVMDGHFVPNLTIGAPVVKSIRKNTHLPLDVHLMIEEPDRYLEDFAKAGSNLLTVHSEACIHLQRTLAEIRKLGMKAGVALNPATPPEHLQYVLQDIDLVLVMSVNPGFGGQKFIQAVLPKIRAIRRMFDEAGRKDVLISVDGGINAETARLVSEAGASVVVAGKSVYGAPDLAAAISELRAAAVDIKAGAA
ncbi:MAG: ribulose-phosphate 3-epimerase [Candidatus Obscuribacterales bacterium]|nr:ribulose-phosphate 3-epimerase [Candidatus Obscuribacterales bacterium]